MGPDEKMAEGISVFFPAFNDAPSLPRLLERTFSTLASCASDYEVIVVDDGSTDATAGVLALAQRRFGPRLRVVHHERNRGYGGALRSGFAAATKDLVFYTDGDGQYDPGELAALLSRLAPGVGLVNGYKLERNDPLHRVAIGKVYNQFARFLFRVKLRDLDCDFRLFRRDLLARMPLTSTSGTICVELVKKIELTGCRIEEVGVSHYAREHGSSQFFRWRSLLTTLRQLIALYWRTVLFPHREERQYRKYAHSCRQSQTAVRRGAA
jgi:glycosyltransferase involved in cell wall biosynthesis